MSDPGQKKHPCPDCRYCQWCNEDRCRLCQKTSTVERLSLREQINRYEELNRNRMHCPCSKIPDDSPR